MNVWIITAALAYLAAAGLLWRQQRDTIDAATPRLKLAWILVVAALFCHAYALQLQLLQPKEIVLSLGDALSLFSWQCALLLSLFCLRRPLAHLGIPVFAMAAVGCASSDLIPTGAETIVNETWTIQLHIALSLLAYGVLTIAAVQAIVLAMQDRQLRQHQPAGVTQNLPPLQTMEQMLFELIAVGFFLLSLALVSGLFFVKNLLAQHLVHKTVLSVAAWIVFAVLLWGRRQFGWRGRTAMRWTLGGYASLLLAYFGSKYVLEQLLGTHWH